MDNSLFASTEMILLLIAFSFAFVSFISVLLFTNITLKYIESKMAEEGKKPPEWDKGIGARIIIYASAIVWKSHAKTPLADGETVRKYARPIDRKISIVMHLSFALFFLLTIASEFV
ncbi:hypothetical protein GCM10009092_20170 [Bowmanella denitrificans]|uniref:Uncharacterized protein n=1 Tax=Bowmanella denitrificans TaxID=366582 RepID=A0ABN0X5S1_9ALTE